MFGSRLRPRIWRGHDTARRRTAGVVAALIAGTLGGLPALGASASTAPGTVAAAPASAHWRTVFSDRFAGRAGSRAGAKWAYDIGTQYKGSSCPANWGTGEVETERASTANVRRDGHGHLVIRALDSGGQWTSGRIETKPDRFAAPAGGEMKVVASLRQPDPRGGLGYWPAFWMLGAGFRASGAGTSGTMNCSNWPSTGEVDIMEDVNALSEVAGTLHCGTDPGGPCNETTGQGSGLRACSGCQTGYNTYSVIVNRTNTSAESITWLLNGNAYFTLNESTVGTSAWQAAVDHGFFIILDEAIGGGFPNAICGCTSPSSATSSGGSMSVGYVAVYTTTGGGGGGHTVTVTNPGNQSGTVGTAVSLQVHASDSASGQTLTYSATGLPAGLSINSSTGLISGTPTTAATSNVTVKATDTTGASGSAAFSWTISSSGGGGGGKQCTTTATSDISADCFSASQGTISVTAATGDSNPAGVDGNQAAQLVNGDHLEYTNVNFGTTGSTQFDARVASGAAG